MGGDRAERIEARGFLEEQIMTRKEEAVDLADKFKTKAQEIEDEVIDLANKFQATAERIDGHVWVSISSQGTNQQLLAHTPAVRASYFRYQRLPLAFDVIYHFGSKQPAPSLTRLVLRPTRQTPGRGIIGDGDGNTLPTLEFLLTTAVRLMEHRVQRTGEQR